MRIRLLFCALLLCLLPACVMAPPTPPVQMGSENTVISINLVTAQPSSTNTVVQFRLWSEEYTHVVQEITLDSGKTLIEAFRWDGLILDWHSWPDRPHWRTMTVYAAVVEGMDEQNGWGHLPDNGAGLKTTVGKDFNADYQASYETRGRIVVRCPIAFTWKIVDDGTTIDVQLPQ